MYHFELWFAQDICPVVEMLGHMVVLFLVFFFFFFLKEFLMLFFRMFVSTSHQQCRRFPISQHSPQQLYFVGFFDDDHSDQFLNLS